MGNKAISTLEGKSSLLDGSYGTRKNAIQKCFKAAKSLGYNIFAIQDGGRCASSATAKSTYNKYGTSTTCNQDGEGAAGANEVYEIIQGKSLYQTLVTSFYLSYCYYRPISYEMHFGILGNPACDPATWSDYDDSCCTSEKPCGIGQGDCDENDQCAEGLVCGKGKGSCGSGFPATANCCEKGKFMLDI